MPMSLRFISVPASVTGGFWHAHPEGMGAQLDGQRFGWQHPHVQLRLAGPQQATAAQIAPG